MRRLVILDAFAADQGDAAFWSGLRALGELVVYPRSEPDEAVARAAGAFAVFTNKVAVRQAELAALPDLRYVGVIATGTDTVDLDAARAREVAVTNVPGYGTAAVAELVFALVLSLARDVDGHAAAVAAGRWAASPDFCFFLRPQLELAGKTLVLVGSGAIGGAVGRIGEAFGMRVVRAAVPGAPPRADATGAPAARTPLADALPQADVVSLHCPLTPATRGLVDARFLAAMKPGAILVNTARGALVNEGDLLAALAGGRLGGVGLDVLPVEPPPAAHPLLDPRAPWRDRVRITPHIGWGTVEARRRVTGEVAENLAAFLRGERRNRVA